MIQGTLSRFVGQLATNWRIYAFNSTFWEFLWKAIRDFQLTDGEPQPPWREPEDSGRRIILRLLSDIGFWEWEWTRCRFPLPRTVSCPQSRKFLLSILNYDPDDLEGPLGTGGLRHSTLHDVHTAATRIRLDKGRKIISDLVNMDNWDSLDQRVGGPTSRTKSDGPSVQRVKTSSRPVCAALCYICSPLIE